MSIDSKNILFVAETPYDSIGEDGFIATHGVAVSLASILNGAPCILLNPITEHGKSTGKCRIAIDFASLPDLVAALVRIMAEDAAASRAAVDAYRGRPAGEPAAAPDPEVPVMLSPLELSARFGHGAGEAKWGSVPEYPRQTWLRELAEGTSSSGYWEWVSERQYNDRIDRELDLDHAAEALLVERCMHASNQYDTTPWEVVAAKAVGHGPWVEVSFPHHDEVRTCVKLENGKHIAFYAEFHHGKGTLKSVGSFPFDPATQFLG